VLVRCPTKTAFWGRFLPRSGDGRDGRFPFLLPPPVCQSATLASSGWTPEAIKHASFFAPSNAPPFPYLLTSRPAEDTRVYRVSAHRADDLVPSFHAAAPTELDCATCSPEAVRFSSQVQRPASLFLLVAAPRTSSAKTVTDRDWSFPFDPQAVRLGHLAFFFFHRPGPTRMTPSTLRAPAPRPRSAIMSVPFSPCSVRVRTQQRFFVSDRNQRWRTVAGTFADDRPRPSLPFSLKSRTPFLFTLRDRVRLSGGRASVRRFFLNFFSSKDSATRMLFPTTAALMASHSFFPLFIPR